MAALARLRARLPALREEYFRRNRYPEGPAARWRRSAKNRWLRSLPPPAPGLVLRAKGRPQSQGLEPAVVPYTPPAWACPLSAHSFIYLFTYLFRLTENPPVAERADGSDPHCLKLSSVKQTGQLVSLAPEIRLVFFFFLFLPSERFFLCQEKKEMLALPTSPPTEQHADRIPPLVSPLWRGRFALRGFLTMKVATFHTSDFRK